MAVRSRYNTARLAGRWDELRGADFLFLREFAYAAMFRFNRRDEFNVPYGGISYNRKSLADKARLLFGAPMLARLGDTRVPQPGLRAVPGRLRTRGGRFRVRRPAL